MSIVWDSGRGDIQFCTSLDDEICRVDDGIRPDAVTMFFEECSQFIQGFRFDRDVLATDTVLDRIVAEHVNDVYGASTGAVRLSYSRKRGGQVDYTAAVDLLPITGTGSD